MDAYSIRCKFYYNGKLKHHTGFVDLVESPKDYTEICGSTFGGLMEARQKYGSVIPVTAGETRKGERFLQLYDSIFARITKENCKPGRLVVESMKTDVSFDEIMGFDAENVIQYLQERGITTCPIMHR